MEKKPSLRQRLRAFFARISRESTTPSEEASPSSHDGGAQVTVSPSVEITAPSDSSIGQPVVSPLSRYLYDKAHFSIANNRVKERAFLPPPSLRLSVFVVDALNHSEIVKLGGAVTDRELRAYAKLDAAVPIAQGLIVERDDKPFRHAEIAGWPAEKEHQKEIAQELASAATLHPV